MVDNKRREIVTGVWAVIAEQGLAAVSMRSVANASGVSVGRIQHYFGSKAELVRASVTEMLQAAAEANVDALQATDDPHTLWRLLAHSLDPASESRRGMSVFYAYVAASVDDPWISQQLAQAKQGQIEQVTACLRSQHPEVPEPREAARRLVSMADGLSQAVYLGVLSGFEATALLRHDLPAAPVQGTG